MKIPNNIKIVSFVPVEEPELALKYYQGHREVLRQFNIDFIADLSHWIFNKNVVCFCILNDKNKMICGLRFQIKLDSLLPLESALGDKSKMLKSLIAKKEKEGKIAEMCNLWVDRKYVKLGLPKVLSEYAILEMKKTSDIVHLFNFYSTYTKELVESVGFQQITDLENDGKFPFPTDDYISFVGVQKF